MASWRGSRGPRGSHGRGGFWNARRPQRMPMAEESPPPPLGDVIEVIARGDISESDAETQTHCGITDTKFIASYNWLDQPSPEIVVPGKPPLWTPPNGPQQLHEDSGVFYRDRNAASYPSHPLEPAIVSVMKMHPQPTDVDVFACGSTLGNLLRFVRGEDKPFRMLVEVVGGTVHLVRRENSPTQQIPGVRGYGHTFPNAYTTWESDVRRSKSHQRILKYKFQGLNIMLRFEGDGYIDLTSRPRRASNFDENDVLDHFEGLKIRSAGSGVVESKGLQVTEGGDTTPQNTIFDLKTRSIKAKDDRDTLGEELPRLWVSRIHKFILAYHERGLFNDIEVQDVWDDVQAWEKANQPSLRRLKALLHRVTNKALEDDEVKLEIVRQEGGPLEIRKRLSDAGHVFSDKVRQQWSEWLEERGGAHLDAERDGWPSTSLDQTAGEVSDSDSECDFTACGEECGYCGRCRN